MGLSLTIAQIIEPLRDARRLLVASGSFSKEATMLIFVLVFAVMELVILGPIAGELGKHSQAAASTATSDAMVSEK